MKYDIAKNDDGPLRRTKAKKDNVKSLETPLNPGGNTLRPATAALVTSDQEALPRNHPGIDQRLSDIEAHLAVRYGTSRFFWICSSLTSAISIALTSSFTSAHIVGEAQICRRPYRQIREGLSTLGGPSLQSTK